MVPRSGAYAADDFIEGLEIIIDRAGQQVAAVLIGGNGIDVLDVAEAVGELLREIDQQRRPADGLGDLQRGGIADDAGRLILGDLGTVFAESRQQLIKLKIIGGFAGGDLYNIFLPLMTIGNSFYSVDFYYSVL